MVNLIAPSVWTDITAAAAGAKGPSHVAVAYFGPTGDTLLPLKPGSALVVDASVNTVKAGSTDPHALRRLHSKGVNVFSAQYLHAKVYAFDKVGFIGSANVSTNSAKNLLEAVFKTRDNAILNEIRKFVGSLCITALSASDIKDLEKLYLPASPPPPPAPAKLQSPLSTLVMDLKAEQGLGRETQVQPPVPVWEHYFSVNLSGALPQLTLINREAATATPVTLPIVKHHHNFTIEISGAVPPRPAILELREIGTHTYEYRVHRPGTAAFAARDHLLSIKNPLWTSGRRWQIV